MVPHILDLLSWDLSHIQ